MMTALSYRLRRKNVQLIIAIEKHYDYKNRIQIPFFCKKRLTPAPFLCEKRIETQALTERLIKMSGKTNYQLILDQTLKEITDSGDVPTLLLHSCCAPCSSYCLEYLSDYFRITVFYYNPNIEDEEFERRYREQVRLVSELKTKNPVCVVRGEHDTDLYYSAVAGHEDDPEGGERCRMCFELRLEEAAKIAKENGFDYFTTTLSISPLKNAELLNSIGREMSEKYGVRYLYSDFKKRNGYLRSIELSKEHSLYRQDYCGCVFSKRQKFPE